MARFINSIPKAVFEIACKIRSLSPVIWKFIKLVINAQMIYSFINGNYAVVMNVKLTMTVVRFPEELIYVKNSLTSVKGLKYSLRICQRIRKYDAKTKLS